MVNYALQALANSCRAARYELAYPNDIKIHSIFNSIFLFLPATLFSGNAELICTFDDASDDCLALQLGGNVEWTIMKAMSTPGPDLPKVDGEQAIDGMYAYLEAKSGAKKGDFGMLKTRLLTTADNAECVRFEYYFYGTKTAKVQLIRNVTTFAHFFLFSTDLFYTSALATEPTRM